ncbi:MAG: YfcC family protein, partial [Bacteroidales bacterium]|nr:YfcC family protein [Bacteroidales bacterium]
MKKIPNTYVIIAALIVLCAVLTWFVPGGTYVTGEDGTLSYERVEAAPQTWQVFSAVYHGFVKQAGIIIFILVVGGAFWLLNATGAVTAGISRFIARVGRRDKWVLVAITVLFSLAGAVFGMSEETIPFVGIVVPLVVSMGYDALMGMLIVYVASNIGFSAAFLNPFTVGIAQDMAGLPLFSGMGYRVFCWAVLTALTALFVVIYAHKTRKAPAEAVRLEDTPLTNRHGWILVVLLLTVVALIVGVTVWEWYLPEITALFLGMGIVCGIIAGFGANRIAEELLAGAKDILSAALVVGFASG